MTFQLKLHNNDNIISQEQEKNFRHMINFPCCVSFHIWVYDSLTIGIEDSSASSVL